MLTDSIIHYPASWQAGMGLIIKSTLKELNINLDIDKVCERLGIGRSTAYDAKKLIDNRLFGKTADSKIRQLEKTVAEQSLEIRKKDFKIEELEYLQENPDEHKLLQRHYFSDDYKRFIQSLKKKYSLTHDQIGDILNIPVNTLKKFSQVTTKPLVIAHRELPPEVFELVNRYLRTKGCKKSVKDFCRKNKTFLETIGMGYRQAVKWLSKLGFVSPKGIFLKNTGLDKIVRFKPNSVWGSDGKQMKIIINGTCFKWVWQCLIDYKTTVIVGGFIGETETTENLLCAIRQTKEQTGVTPLAIVIDNRLSENLPAIKTYLDQWGIEIIKTYPGNPKSAGIVEGNFNIFERWVGGTIMIEGNNLKELSKAIAITVVTIFTQLRNHKPRKKISLKTPMDTLNEALNNPLSEVELSELKVKINALVHRHQKNQSIPLINEQKRSAIDFAIKVTHPPHIDVFRQKLSHPLFTADHILQALAIFKTRIQDFPDEHYDHAYFGGILRNITDQSSLEALYANLDDVYYHNWTTLQKKKDDQILSSLQHDSVATLFDLADDFVQMEIPAYSHMILQQMKECFYMAACGSSKKTNILRTKLASYILKFLKATKRQKENLLNKVFEWENSVRIFCGK